MKGYSREVVVKNKKGIHARPASLIAKKAKEFPQSEVFLEKQSDPGEFAAAKSIMGVMAQAAPQGEILRVFSRHKSDQEAIDAIVAVIESGFGEEC